MAGREASHRVFYVLAAVLSVAQLLWALHFSGWQLPGFPEAAGRAGGDFILAEAAARLLVEQGPLALYDAENYNRAFQTLKPEGEYYLPWPYSPLYHFLLWPLAQWDGDVALQLWIGFGLLCWAFACWQCRDLWQARYGWALLFLPAVTFAAAFGQNGLVIGAILLLAFDGWRKNQPGRAGFFAALLLLKPQLGLMLGLWLLLSKRWRMLGFALLWALALILLSSLVFGMELWPRYVQVMLHMPTARLFESWQPGMVTQYNQFLYLTGHAPLALVAYGLCAAFTAWLACRCLKIGDARFYLPVFTAGCFVLAPHGFVYDLPLMMAALWAFYHDFYDQTFALLLCVAMLLVIPLQLFAGMGGLLLLLWLVYLLLLQHRLERKNAR